MNKKQLAARTRQFAIEVFRLAERFPKTEPARKAASSVAANYRAANQAKSTADFINKLKIVLEEADECNFWLTFAADVGLASMGIQKLVRSVSESGQLVAIFAAFIKTLKGKGN
jgi:four helix bundle protein